MKKNSQDLRGGAHNLKDVSFPDSVHREAAGGLQDNKLKTIEDYKKYYAALEEMAGFIVNVYRSLGISAERSTDPVSVFWGQTERKPGVLFHFSYNALKSFGTILGEERAVIIGSSHEGGNKLEEAREIIIKKFGLVEIDKDVYVATKDLNGDPIPPVKLVNDNTLNYKEIQDLWNKVKPEGRKGWYVLFS